MTADAQDQNMAPIEWGRSFFFFRDDPEWMKKIALGALFSLLSAVLVGTFFLAGYSLRLLVSVARGIDDRLPEWDDFGTLFADGLKAVGIYFALVLPPALVPAGMGCVIGLLGPLMQKAGDAGEVAAVIAIVLLFGLMLVWMVCLWAVVFYVPAAIIRLALTGEFRAGFAFRENVAFIRRNLGQYLLALVIYLAASAVAVLGYLACCVGVLATSFWAICVLAWGLGSVARRDPETAALLARGASGAPPSESGAAAVEAPAD